MKEQMVVANLEFDWIVCLGFNDGNEYVEVSNIGKQSSKMKIQRMPITKETNQLLCGVDLVIYAKYTVKGKTLCVIIRQFSLEQDNCVAGLSDNELVLFSQAMHLEFVQWTLIVGNCKNIYLRNLEFLPR